MIKRLFHRQTKSVGGATSVLAVSYIVSGVLGIFRDRLLANVFGAGIETSIYFAAFRIPDLVYNILILGGITVAFLPLFSEYFAKSEEKAWEMTNHILNIFLFLLFFGSLILFFLSPWLMPFIAPGFSPENQSILLDLVRLLLLSPILLGVSSILSGVLQYFDRFLIYSLAPVLYNVGIIFGIIFLVPHFGIFGAGIGVIIGALLHLLVQIPSVIGCGFNYKFSFDFKYPAIARIFKLMTPRVFAVLSNQINLFILTSLASGIADNAIAVFSFARNIQGLPVGILGMSLATALFPTFSRLWTDGKKTEFIEKFSAIFRQSIFILIPVSVFTFVLRGQIVRLILGQLAPEAEKLISVSLGLLSSSILTWALIPLVTRAFFSFHESKTPAVITLLSVCSNLLMSFLFIHFLSFPNALSDFTKNITGLSDVSNIAVIGLSLAFSFSSFLQIILLLISLNKQMGGFGARLIISSFLKTALAGIVSGIFAYFVLASSLPFFNADIFSELFLQTFFVILIGFLFFAFIAFALKIPELKMIHSLIKTLVKKNNG